MRALYRKLYQGTYESHLQERERAVLHWRGAILEEIAPRISRGVKKYPGPPPHIFGRRLYT